MNKPERSQMIPLKPRRNLIVKSLAGITFSLLGLFLLTGFSPNVWLFLLYPPLILLLFVSLGSLGVHLLRRFTQ